MKFDYNKLQCVDARMARVLSYFQITQIQENAFDEQIMSTMLIVHQLVEQGLDINELLTIANNLSIHTKEVHPVEAEALEMYVDKFLIKPLMVD